MTVLPTSSFFLCKLIELKISLAGSDFKKSLWQIVHLTDEETNLESLGDLPPINNQLVLSLEYGLRNFQRDCLLILKAVAS